MRDKFQIPKAIRDAVHNALASYPVAANTGHTAEIACEAFAKALTENPVIPTHEQAIALCEVFEDKDGSRKPDYCDSIRAVAIEFQRRMFDAPEPEVPEEIRAMLVSKEDGLCDDDAETVNSRIIEAYRRGQKSMFNAPGPEVPECPSDLLFEIKAGMDYEASCVSGDEANQHILEAYRRGRESK